jgi:hypothetical protein
LARWVTPIDLVRVDFGFTHEAELFCLAVNTCCYEVHFGWFHWLCLLYELILDALLIEKLTFWNAMASGYVHHPVFPVGVSAVPLIDQFIGVFG